MREFNNYMWDDSSCTATKRTLCQIGIPACGDPGEPLHGYRLPDDRTTYSVNATLHFTCQEGYTLSGESVLSCMNSGAWNHQRPSCESVECEGSPPEVALASTMILGSAYQDIALYTCQDGYIPDNEPISFCQHSGTWSTPKFTCSALSPCSSNPCFNGGTCTVNGSAFTCTCPSSYTGPTCEEEFSPCNSSPCMNGGTCSDVDESSFSCTCTPGYIDPTCNEEIMLTTPITFTTQATPQSTESQTESNSAGGSSSSIATVIGSVVGAILGIVIIIVLIIIFYKRRSNESATTKSKGKESDSSPQYENPVFDQSQTDAHTYQDLNTITHTYQDCNTDVRSYDDNVDPHTYQEANYEEVNDAKEKNYVNDTMIKQNKVLLG
ncbi:delta and Notch-like epidermal growth factor-related receptor [Strongylocentrotus purpuratus]|uniref:Uncharacterized protein n=1 Tax=Strongylocentrotus purpuratus TaxID=7668 RepID=A0A7M7NBU8_STRPU|nr:delta and Notch-like epidermal growth factor-related receptor [Strongylocentrotus purpuratus]